MNFLERLELAMREAGRNRAETAEAIGLTVQAISKLKRTDDSALKARNAAKAARFLECDLYWLCTGEGAYRRAPSYMALEVAALFDAVDAAHRDSAFAVMYRMARGQPPAEAGNAAKFGP
jgi:DNA-binding Xre family transcriptional regulator